MTLPLVVVTGSSGFIGRRLLTALMHEHRVIGMARRSQSLCGAPFHENIRWLQVDIGRRDELAAAWTEVKAAGPVAAVVHLAAHYDFTGENHPEYERTNVKGLRYVLEECRQHPPGRFIFSSSVAACRFPPAGGCLNEDSVPDGDHIYARSKAAGEAMLREYSDAFPSLIIRFAALFSDWCEYPPLYMFLRTWLSRAWNRRILGGRGESAIPYLHAKDGIAFVMKALRRADRLDDGEILVASPDGSTSHRELFAAATRYWFDREEKPLFTPRFLVKPGIFAMGLLGRFQREKPFERLWMADYVDRKMAIDASRSRARLDWAPRERLEIIRRLPFLLENRRGYRPDWIRRNRDALKQGDARPCLAISYVLDRHKDEISERCTAELSRKYESYAAVEPKQHEWNHALILRILFNAVRTRERLDFMAYCRDLAQHRMDQGFSAREIVGALETLNSICVDVVRHDPEAQHLVPHLNNYLTLTVQYGIDQIREACDEWHEAHPEPGVPDPCAEHDVI